MRSHRNAKLMSLMAAPAVLALMTVSLGAVAAEWSYMPFARYHVEYNDNRRLSFTDKEDIVGHIVRLNTELKYRTERTEMSLVPELRFERWWGDRELDTDDQKIDFEGLHATERWRFEALAGYKRDTTLRGDFDSQDSARISERRRRETVTAAPTVRVKIWN